MNGRSVTQGRGGYVTHSRQVNIVRDERHTAHLAQHTSRPFVGDKRAPKSHWTANPLSTSWHRGVPYRPERESDGYCSIEQGTGAAQLPQVVIIQKASRAFRDVNGRYP